MKLNEHAYRLAESVARTTVKVHDVGESDTKEARPLLLLARAFIVIRDQIRGLHDLVDQTDPNDPIGVALTKVDLACRPMEPREPHPRLARAFEELTNMTALDLLKLYCEVMGENEFTFGAHRSYIVRQWDGMDGCWTDCTGRVLCEQALRLWADRTNGGSRRVTYAETDYYRIFPADEQMVWDGSEGWEMHR